MSSDPVSLPRYQLQIALLGDSAGETLVATLVEHDRHGIVVDVPRDIPVGTLFAICFDIDDFGEMEARFAVKICTADGDRFRLSADRIASAPIDLPDRRSARSPGDHGVESPCQPPETQVDVDQQHVAEVHRRLALSVEAA